jgi:hypothetical protein
MTIKISACVLLDKPQSNDTLRYHITTSRAVARTREDDDLHFELKFFYDVESTNNTVPGSYGENECVHFTGNLTDVIDNVLHINVQHAHSLGMITPPRHCVEVNLNGRTCTVPANFATDTISSSPPSSSTKSWTTFKVTATQWVALPRSGNAVSAKGKNTSFDFTVHHTIDHRLASRTSHLSKSQNINILGLLEIIDEKLFIQLTDISWNSSNGGFNSSSSSQLQSTTSSKSRWSNDVDPPPAISSTRALAAKLATSNTGVTQEDGRNSKKRARTKQSSTSGPADDVATQDKSSSSKTSPSSKKRVRSTQSTPSSSQNRTLRSSKHTGSKDESESDSNQGNVSYPFSKLTMVGGIPQFSTTLNMQPLHRVAKLRDHAISVLPVRPFSYF